MTQEQLAKGITTKSFISQMERGRVLPSLSTLERLCERLEVPTSFLLGDSLSPLPLEWLLSELEDLVCSAEAGCSRCRKLIGKLNHTIARAYDALGLRDEALKSYRRACQLLPDGSGRFEESDV